MHGVGAVCLGAVGAVAFAILLVFIMCARLLEVRLASQDLRERDPVFFFFEACTATFFIVMPSLTMMFL